MNNIWILAEADGVTTEPLTTEETFTTTQAPADPNAPAAGTRSKPIIPPFLLIGLMFVFMYFLLFRGPRKKQQQQKKMVQKLQKNDRIRTIGGIIGTIVDVKDDVITLKVDESNNTKIKIAVSAVGTNLSQQKD